MHCYENQLFMKVSSHEISKLSRNPFVKVNPHEISKFSRNSFMTVNSHEILKKTIIKILMKTWLLFSTKIIAQILEIEEHAWANAFSF
jgi:hypothetical protein